MKLLKLFIIFLTLSLSFPSAYSQDFTDEEPEYIEDEGGGLWDRRLFEDSSGMQEDFDSGGGEYIGEEEAVEAIESVVEEERADKKINIKEVLETEKELKYDNLKYGALTGVMIGGWMAMVSNISGSGSDSRNNARFIGMGAVLGTLLGTAIGTKSLYEEQLRSDNMHDSLGHPQFRESEAWAKKFSIGTSKDGLAQLNFMLRF